ncbi:endonuclease/exonuclease/phosphatase family protein [Agriterribacter sp.]|uniref:endonuclease/exonuclease/phosphatase family protein n=1 Tax=Agriterribacter sp. TaxID=2821509 RepID=UPI002CB49783|nr:endonuclease/exonuclease/phosphatase family protein [Agriterribacter sp.]HTN06573.1 endonuclease/exonuclease/phosphatase family protein [Agriterribacter sp.]
MKIILSIPLICFVLATAGCAPKISNTATGKTNATLRIMAYNVHHCNPPSKPGFIDVDAVAKVIQQQNPDLVALQEIDVNINRSGKIDEAALLAEKLNMHVFFGKAIDHDGGDYGVAILSKYPLSEEKVHRLPTVAETKGEPRVLATALVTLPGGIKIQFGTTHLDALRTDTNRVIQVKEINRLAISAPHPFIVAGDFNDVPGSNAIHLLDQQFTRTCDDCGFTIPVINPDKTIDFIAFSKNSTLTAVSHEVIPERYASDHLPVVAVVEWSQ